MSDCFDVSLGTDQMSVGHFPNIFDYSEHPLKYGNIDIDVFFDIPYTEWLRKLYLPQL